MFPRNIVGKGSEKEEAINDEKSVIDLASIQTLEKNQDHDHKDAIVSKEDTIEHDESNNNQYHMAHDHKHDYHNQHHDHENIKLTSNDQNERKMNDEPHIVHLNKLHAHSHSESIHINAHSHGHLHVETEKSIEDNNKESTVSETNQDQPQIHNKNEQVIDEVKQPNDHVHENKDIERQDQSHAHVDVESVKLFEAMKNEPPIGETSQVHTHEYSESEHYDHSNNHVHEKSEKSVDVHENENPINKQQQVDEHKSDHQKADHSHNLDYEHPNHQTSSEIKTEKPVPFPLVDKPNQVCLEIYRMFKK